MTCAPGAMARASSASCFGSRQHLREARQPGAFQIARSVAEDAVGECRAARLGLRAAFVQDGFDIVQVEHGTARRCGAICSR